MGFQTKVGGSVGGIWKYVFVLQLDKIISSCQEKCLVSKRSDCFSIFREFTVYAHTQTGLLVDPQTSLSPWHLDQTFWSGPSCSSASLQETCTSLSLRLHHLLTDLSSLISTSNYMLLMYPHLFYLLTPYIDNRSCGADALLEQPWRGQGKDSCPQLEHHGSHIALCQVSSLSTLLCCLPSLLPDSSLCAEMSILSHN